MQTIFRPETLQALMAMLMGQAGRQIIPVGGTPVPVGAFTNLLSVLANQAAEEYNAVAPANGENPRYLQDFAGETTGDPAVAEYRAAALWELLQEAGVEQQHSHAFTSRQPSYREDEQELNDELYDAYDAMDLVELEEYGW